MTCVSLYVQDKHEWVIRDGDGWRYPEPIVLAVSILNYDATNIFLGVIGLNYWSKLV